MLSNAITKTTRRAMLELLVMLGAVAVMIAPAHAEWSTYQGNAAHTGYVSGNIDTSNLSARWSSPLMTSALDNLAVGVGGVYVNGRYSVTDVNEQTGAILWNNVYDPNQMFFVTAPAYANGTVYYQSVDGSGHSLLNGVSAATGSRVFATSYSNQFAAYLSPTPYAGVIYTGGGEYGGIYAYNGTTGAQDWFGYEAQYGGWTPAADGKYLYSYTGSGDQGTPYGQFRMIDPATGSTTYLVADNAYDSLGGNIGSAVVLGPHNDAFATNVASVANPSPTLSGRLIAFSTLADATHTPQILWTISDHFRGQATLANGVLYANDNGNVVALDESTGSALWSWTPPTGSPIGPMIATDNVLFLSTGSTTYALDLVTHQADWSFGVSGSLALSDNMLFVAGSNGTLYAFATPEPSFAIGFVSVGFCLLTRSRRRAQLRL